MTFTFSLVCMVVSYVTYKTIYILFWVDITKPDIVFSSPGIPSSVRMTVTVESNLILTCGVQGSSVGAWSGSVSVRPLYSVQLTVGYIRMRGRIIFLCLCVVIPTKCEVFSSVSDMKAVFQLERNLVGELLNYAEKLQRKLNRIKKWESIFHWRYIW